ncbi:hypothetical protein DY023_06995 [Microbacterium bovistercoris]|uniref:Uncharacterized protein n=1 Tax=Microbacterium bovistercoris TaxID=2293570 RepID=A0A371NUR4_9MICO|nr:hypothetical protein [Microbacterium bovistercoris]REJ06213.1 hypothetical protein DY023_06995 [Microbacterium bovistercoris]
MDWIGDPAIGDWLRERLDDDLGVVPRGFTAYARILHPAQVRSLPDRAVPTSAEWERMPEAEREILFDRLVDEPATWAEAADAFGTALHPLAQWRRIVRTPPEEDWNLRIAPDGREFTSPDEGVIGPDLFAAIAQHLAAHTATPDAGVAAVWEGWGGLVGFFGESPSRAFFQLGAEPAHERMLQQSIHDPFNNPFRKPAWQPGILSDEISKAPRLELPGREYVTFTAGASSFADPAWVTGAPWRDRPAEEHGFAVSAQHPNLLWPEDHAWVMVSEIDFDSTIVAGSAALIDALIADPALEAFAIAEDADLTWDGDEVNG